MTIRVLGGLLSTHVLLQRDPSISPGYDGQLLAMATDMAERMLPAFETQSGVPLPWAHLQGVSAGGQAGWCVQAAAPGACKQHCLCSAAA